MLPHNFRPDGTYELVRLGKDHDGGYLVDPASIVQTKSVLSCGIFTDWSFERDFLKRNDVPVFAYDGTINPRKIIRLALKYFLRLRLPRALFTARALFDYFVFFRTSRVHRRLNIGYDSASARSLGTIFKEENPAAPVFVKMDIEGWEYRALDDLLAQAENLSGLAIEFHDVDLHRERIMRFIEAFPLTLVHIHSTNHGMLVDGDGNPRTLELTFSSNPTRVSDGPTIPHPLDQVSHPKRPPLPMAFE